MGSTIRTISENNCIGKCPDENFLNAVILLAHVNCTKYCHCSRGKAIVKNCESNLMFNFCDGVCDKPKNVKCRSDQIDSDGTPNSKDDESQFESFNAIVIYSLLSIILIIGFIVIIAFVCKRKIKFHL